MSKLGDSFFQNFYNDIIILRDDDESLVQYEYADYNIMDRYLVLVPTYNYKYLPLGFYVYLSTRIYVFCYLSFLSVKNKMVFCCR